MAAPPPDARSQLAQVTRVRPCGGDGFLLTVRPEEPLGAIDAGRFFMLRREDGASPAIPRPFSLYRQQGAELTFMIQVLGDGTRALERAPLGGEVRLIGPLGKGWPELPAGGAPVVCLAGGVGVAPFYALLAERGCRLPGATPTLIFGAQTADRLYDLEAFEALGIPVLATTDDGSHGFRGHVVACLEEAWSRGRLPREVRLLACGPEPMLKAIERLARERDLECWVSLETLMGCGVGICNGCIVPTREEGVLGDWPFAKCCLDGPVFRTDAIQLE